MRAPVRIVLATGNLGKLAEAGELLKPLSVVLCAQSEFAVPAAVEDGLTFVENALIKARNAAAVTGLAALADDSGLEVDALNGEPGVHSARYAGPQATDNDNVVRLLQALDKTQARARTARFHCVCVFLRHAADPVPVICHGTWEGVIARQASGANGFGYDPVFHPAGGPHSAASLTGAEKNRVSHRGQAMRAMVRRLSAGVLAQGDATS